MTALITHSIQEAVYLGHQVLVMTRQGTIRKADNFTAHPLHLVTSAKDESISKIELINIHYLDDDRLYFAQFLEL